MATGVNTDYYAVLGVKKTASDEEIRIAFKKMARKHHPDKNRGSKDAEDRFKLINQAYNVIGDVSKRAEYDQDNDKRSKCESAQNPSSGTNAKRTRKEAPFVPPFGDAPPFSAFDMPFNAAFFDAHFPFDEFAEFVPDDMDEMFGSPFFANMTRRTSLRSKNANKRREHNDAFVRCKFCLTNMNVVELCEHEPFCARNPNILRNEAGLRESHRRAAGIFGDPDDFSTDFFYPASNVKIVEPGFGFGFNFPHVQPDEVPDSARARFADAKRRTERDSVPNRSRKNRAKANEKEAKTSKSRVDASPNRKPFPGAAPFQKPNATNHRNGTAGTSQNKPHQAAAEIFVRGTHTRAEAELRCPRCRGALGNIFACTCGVRTAR